MIEILSTGAVNSVQDHGRFGFLNAGVSWSGAMDRVGLDIANLMVGNASDAAGLEVALFPFRLKFHAPTCFAITGTIGPAKLNDQDLPPWWSAVAKPGDILQLGLPQQGARATIAFAGGIAVPSLLGSASTDLKSGFGGLDGRGLKRGDMLTLGPQTETTQQGTAAFGIDPSSERGKNANVLRVLTAAEYPLFSSASHEAFWNTPWTVSTDANRQGCRLEGPRLALERKLELFSHGIMPGTVQVPPSGEPVIQLADANTCGGYPKIACVISADLWKLAQAPTGTRLQFQQVNEQQALDALKGQTLWVREAGLVSRLARRQQEHAA